METIYLVCATVGGTLLVCQFVMTLFGLGHHDLGGEHDIAHGTAHDADHDHDTSWFVGILTFRTIVAALTFFGLAGLAAASSELEPPVGFGMALLAGLAAMFL